MSGREPCVHYSLSISISSFSFLEFVLYDACLSFLLLVLPHRHLPPSAVEHRQSTEDPQLLQLVLLVHQPGQPGGGGRHHLHPAGQPRSVHQRVLLWLPHCLRSVRGAVRYLGCGSGGTIGYRRLENVDDVYRLFIDALWLFILHNTHLRPSSRTPNFWILEVSNRNC